MTGVDYRVDPILSNSELNELYRVSWPNHHEPYDFAPELRHALTVVCAYRGDELVGFVRVAWDGGVHAFLLEPTVHPNYRHRGIGRSLVEQAADVARQRGMEWLHVDYEPQLHPFYAACGFKPTHAGLIRLR